MSDKKNITLSYLKENEVIELYELFFGKLLVRRPDFSYIDNLKISLSKTNFVQSYLARLNTTEYEILKILSKEKFVPYRYIADKLSIILKLQNSQILKAINILIQKSYIFLRNNNMLVIPNIYFDDEGSDEVEYDITNSNSGAYNSQIVSDISSMIMYFISNDIKFTSDFFLYKKDVVLLENIFLNYSLISKEELLYVVYFFQNVLQTKDARANTHKIKEYFKLTDLQKILFVIKEVFSYFHPLFDFFHSFDKNVIISKDKFKQIWERLFILQDLEIPPIKADFNEFLNFCEKCSLVSVSDDFITINTFAKNIESLEEKMITNSNYSIYISANFNDEDVYILPFFSRFVKYDKITEYEINEESIKRFVEAGFEYKDIISFFNKNKLSFSSGVEQTIKQWVDKYGSFYFVNGTLFFCENEEKFKLIETLIDNGAITAYEVKKNEVFLIEEQDKKTFFDFLDKSGIKYYEKNVEKRDEKNDTNEIRFDHLFSLKKTTF